MIERHTCYYKVNNNFLYRQIYNAESFEQDMKDIGIFKREITILREGEYKGVFEIDPVTHPNKGFKYFEDRGIFFSMTRPSIVENLERDKAAKECQEKLQNVQKILKLTDKINQSA